MEKVLDWGITNVEKIKKENVGEIMLTINAQTSGNAVAPLATDFSKMDIGIFLKRQNSRSDKKIFDGNLEDLIQHCYAGSTMLEVVKTQTAVGINLRFKFGMFPFVLNGDDSLTIKFKGGKASDSFTGATNTNSTIKLYTNPSPEVNSQGLVPVYSTYSVGNGKVNFDENIGSNIAKIVLATDNVATQTASTKPQVVSSRLSAMGGYSEDFSIDELIARNQELLSNNPDSDIRNLVHYSSLNLQNDVQLEVTYDAQAVNETKVLVTHLEVH